MAWISTQDSEAGVEVEVTAAVAAVAVEDVVGGLLHPWLAQERR